MMIWLAVVVPWRASGGKGWLQGQAGLVAATLCAGGLSITYFLTHVVTIRYYLTPAMLMVCLLLGLLFVALETRWLESAVTEPAPLRATRNTLAGAAAAAAVVGLGFGYQALGDTAREVSAPRVLPAPMSAPAEVLDAWSWIWADRYSSSIIYYTGHPAFKLPFSSAETRRLMCGWIKAKGDPQYMVIDSPDMERVAAEARAAGWQLLPAGTVRDVPCFRMEMP